MMKSVYLVFVVLCLNANAAMEPVSYEKIMLANRTPEGVVFMKNQNGKTIAYSANYFVGEKIIRERVLPVEMYQKFMNRLRTEVLPYAAKDISGSCSSEVVLASGIMVAQDGQSKAQEKKAIPLCLNRGSHSRAVAESFHHWYNDAKAIFGL